MTKYAQVGIFKVNKALMEYFVSKTRGTVEVCAVIGHSLGEYNAFDYLTSNNWEDLVTKRGESMGMVEKGNLFGMTAFGIRPLAQGRGGSE